jgi:basic amino acid/polyamine antiporter, APA family
MAFKDLFRKKSVNQILAQVAEGGGDGHGGKLHRTLRVKDLASFGIAAIIGAGIFSTIGKASADGGPGVVFLFAFTALACSFAAFAYAEFASMVPVSGSAYTYSYVAFGELMAWIIGWSLIMEYGIGNITVAISWSDYFTGLLESGGIHLPQWIQMDFLSAKNGYDEAVALMSSGKEFSALPDALKFAHIAWTEAPALGPLRLIADLPALLIIVLITALVYRGMKESKNATNAMVVIKLAVILLVIAVGVFYVDTDNWSPFAPHGISGILKGVSAVFFAYIGFDAISTTAEECENPQRDLPRGMMLAIIICTVLYIAIALVLTGMIKYDQLAVGDPLAFVFGKVNLKWMSGIIAVSAVVAMASVLLVFQMGQPRIWMSMSRDGLLPPAFSRIHPKYKTPSFATVVVGFVVAVPALFMNLTMVTDLCSIGTLFAFVLVCAGVLKMGMDKNAPRGKFKTPYINSRFIMPLLFALGVWISLFYFKEDTLSFLTNKPKHFDASTFVTSLSREEIALVKNEIALADSAGLAGVDGDAAAYLGEMKEKDYKALLDRLPLEEGKKIESGWDNFRHKIPMWIFLIILVGLVISSVVHKHSLIPMLGLVSCLYMMAELGLSNWIGFGIWLAVGLVIYFLYGNRNSLLGKKK